MKKIKIANFSQTRLPDKIKNVELAEQFEVHDVSSSDPQEILLMDYDVIEILPEDFELFKTHIKAVDWRTNVVGIADAFILTEGKYKPANLLIDAVSNIIKLNRNMINSQLPVIVIGEYHFVFSMCAKLAMSGFVEIIFSLSDSKLEMAELIENKLKSFVFDLNIRFVNVNELTTSELVGSLLISDFKKNLNIEAYELLTYFNFLSGGALFIDCNSIRDGFLVEDARKAEIAVIDEEEVITQKYLLLLEKLKISPKV